MKNNAFNHTGNQPILLLVLNEIPDNKKIVH
jgi:hypothetical protein